MRSYLTVIVRLKIIFYTPLADYVLCRLLSTRPGSRLLLADPPTRTVRNRERFMSLIGGDDEDDEAEGSSGAGISTSDSPLVLEECSLHNCEVQQLDAEMTGGE